MSLLILIKFYSFSINMTAKWVTAYRIFIVRSLKKNRSLTKEIRINLQIYFLQKKKKKTK